MTNVQKIARGWVNYAWQNNLKTGTKKYEQAHHAFLLGAHAQADLPPVIQIYIMSGRDVADLDTSMDEQQAVV